MKYMKTKYILLVILGITFINNNLFSQMVKGQGIDTVYSFKPGTGQNGGQDPQDYPKNIFGFPDSTAREDFQASDPSQILSIGMGGEIIVGFKNLEIVDGPGPDFTVFENAFLNPVTKRIFAEPAKIAVSDDGIHFVEFPFDSLTLKGCAGVTPTYGNMNPLNPKESGGDKFDLSDIGLSKISYIKITDICQMILDNPKHPYYDPIITGFDLDAVFGLHLQIRYYESSVSSDNFANNGYFENKSEIRLSPLRNAKITVYNNLGSVVFSENSSDEIRINKTGFPKGLYILVVESGTDVITKKLLIY